MTAKQSKPNQVAYNHAKMKELETIANSLPLKTEAGSACFNKHLAEYGLKIKPDTPAYSNNTINLELVRES